MKKFNSSLKSTLIRWSPYLATCLLILLIFKQINFAGIIIAIIISLMLSADQTGWDKIGWKEARILGICFGFFLGLYPAASELNSNQEVASLLRLIIPVAAVLIFAIKHVRQKEKNTELVSNFYFLICFSFLAGISHSPLMTLLMLMIYLPLIFILPAIVTRTRERKTMATS